MKNLFVGFLFLLISCEKHEKMSKEVKHSFDTISTLSVIPTKKIDSTSLYSCYNYALGMRNRKLLGAKWDTSNAEMIKNFIPKESEIVGLYEGLNCMIDDSIYALKLNHNNYSIEHLLIKILEKNVVMFLFDYTDNECQLGNSGFYIFFTKSKVLYYINCLDYKLQQDPYISFRDIAGISVLDMNFMKQVSVYFYDLRPAYKIKENADQDGNVKGSIGFYYRQEDVKQVDTNTSIHDIKKTLDVNAMYIKPIIKKMYLFNTSHNTLINNNCDYWIGREYKVGSTSCP